MESLNDPDDRATAPGALRTVAEAYGGLGAVAAEAGISRDSPYRHPLRELHPTLKTLLAVPKAVGNETLGRPGSTRCGVSRKSISIPFNSMELLKGVNMLRVLFIAVSLSMPLVTSASETSDVPESVIFTLYANTPSDPFFRVKIATFDYYVKGFEEVDAARNQKFCSEAAEMFQEKWKR
ncbi:MAG TPA: hypothetical protein VIH30_11360, partial [Aquirhabdus sp.]